MLPQDLDEDVIATARARFERERLTRRAALKKVGIRTGVVAGLFFGFDDLVRLVGARMEESRASRGIADTVASDFRGMGLAFGDEIVDCSDCGECEPDEDYTCVDCSDECAAAPEPKKKPRNKCDGTGHYADCKKAEPGRPLECCNERCVQCTDPIKNDMCNDQCAAAAGA